MAAITLLQEEDTHHEGEEGQELSRSHLTTTEDTVHPGEEEVSEETETRGETEGQDEEESREVDMAEITNHITEGPKVSTESSEVLALEEEATEEEVVQASNVCLRTRTRQLRSLTTSSKSSKPSTAGTLKYSKRIKRSASITSLKSS